MRTKSEINQADLQAALQMKNQKNVEKPTPPTPPTRSTEVKVNGHIMTPTDVSSQAQVGDVKSIQVQSKKVTSIVTTKITSPSENLSNGYTGSSQSNEVENLINNAPSLISTSVDPTVDPTYANIPSEFSGEKDDVYVASLDRGDKGLGLGLIDGMVSIFLLENVQNF